MLERLVGKLTRAVLRRGGVSNHSDLSDNETIIVHIASPVTFTVVLHMFKMESMPIIIPIMPEGKPTEVNTIDNVTIPAEGTAAVPTEAITAVIITVMSAEVPKSTPYT